MYVRLLGVCHYTYVCYGMLVWYACMLCMYAYVYYDCAVCMDATFVGVVRIYVCYVR